MNTTSKEITMISQQTENLRRLEVKFDQLSELVQKTLSGLITEAGLSDNEDFMNSLRNSSQKGKLPQPKPSHTMDGQPINTDSWYQESVVDGVTVYVIDNRGMEILNFLQSYREQKDPERLAQGYGVNGYYKTEEGRQTFLDWYSGVINHQLTKGYLTEGQFKKIFKAVDDKFKQGQ